MRGLRELVPTEQRRPHPHGGVLQQAARWMADAPPHRSRDWIDEELRVAEEGEVGLFVGCTPLFETLFADDRQVPATAIAHASVQILNRLGIEPVVCSGPGSGRPSRPWPEPTCRPSASGA